MPLTQFLLMVTSHKTSLPVTTRMWTLIRNKMQNSPATTAVPPVDLSQPPLLSLSLHTKSLAITNLFSISEFCHFESVTEIELYEYVIIRD